MSSTPLLEVRSLCKSFGDLHAVENLSFTIQRGEIYGFIGPNGAGKTTTMRILATLESPTSGDAFIEGVSVVESPREVSDRIGFMPDQFTPYPNLDVMQFLDFFSRAYGLKGKKRVDTVKSIAQFCGLEDFAERLVNKLSKGMEQRLHLAKTLLSDPDLLILDEPANGLDPRARIEFRELLRQLSVLGKSILISSHILSELSEICHGVVVIERGQHVSSGSIASIQQEITAGTAMEMRILSDVEDAQKFLLTQPHVQHVFLQDGALRFDFKGDPKERAALFKSAVMGGLEVIEFRPVKMDFEEIFFKKTKGRLQ